MELFEKWVRSGILSVYPAGRAPFEARQVFNVWKDAGRDRHIFDRRGPNGCEGVVGPGPSRDLPGGAALCDVLVDRGRQLLEMTSCDLTNFYHQARVTEARTRSNVCGAPVPADAFAGFPGGPLVALRAR